MRDVAIIGVASGIGARDPRCEDGPCALRDAGVLGCLDDAAGAISSFEILRISELLERDDVLTRVTEIDRRLALLVAAKLKNRVMPVVVGGDHACAVGTWSGVRAAMPPDKELGLIWVDAHMDSHVPDTSPSGALHGMPLACLLGHGPEPLTGLIGPAPKVRPEHVCLVGVRSFESGENALLERLGVRVIYMEEVRARGLAAVWREAVIHVSRNTVGYGITIDLDAIDPVDAPGVGTPVEEGIAGDELVKVVGASHDDAGFLALEIAEYNPHLDSGGLTLKLLRSLICAAVTGRGCDE